MNSYALCLTEEIVESFSRLYSDNGSVHLTRSQRAMLFTSMVVQPESLMLKVGVRPCSDNYTVLGVMLIGFHYFSSFSLTFRFGYVR